jgi:enoyl-CoA hydratase/carnithine racemase
MPAKINFELHSGVAYVSISSPKRFNAMSRAMWLQLRSCFESIQRNADVRCVLISGAGSHFCAGGDISEYASFRFQEASLREFHENDVWGALSAMLTCDVPIVAQIAGNCMGAGVEIASCCDIRLAGESAKFGAPIARLGFPMAPREAALVAREVGLTTARQMLLQAAVLSAAQMQARGFLTEVVADAALQAHAQVAVQGICQLAPQAARLNKRTIRALNSPLEPVSKAPSAIEFIVTNDPLNALLNTAYAYADSPEHIEGIGAFLEKRAPAF